MQYRSAIRGVARQRTRVDAEYRELVKQLMAAGWYRLGQDRDPSGKRWGFRFGHTTPDPEARARGVARSMPQPEERWIEAKDEVSAMRKLLREV